MCLQLHSSACKVAVTFFLISEITETEVVGPWFSHYFVHQVFVSHVVSLTFPTKINQWMHYILRMNIYYFPQ